MFSTPPARKVITRGALKKEQHRAEQESSLPRMTLARQAMSENLKMPPKIQRLKSRAHTEGSLKQEIEVVCDNTSNRSSHKSSYEARRKQMELEAAEAKAKIERELIDKKLAADLAILEEECSKSKQSQKSQQAESIGTQDKVEQWLERSHLDAEDPPAVELAAPSHIQQLASALKDALTVTALQPQPQPQYPELLARMITSKDLPLFFGDPLDWLHFKEMYLESARLCKYSDSENIMRLRKCLRGEAKETVSSLLIGNTLPDAIIEALELRYGRPDLIIAKIVAQMRKMTPLPAAYHNDIVNFSIKIKNFIAAAEAVQQSDYLRSPELMTTVVSKCPSTLITKWVDFYHTAETSKPKLVLFAEFVHNEATKVAAAGVSHIYSHSETKKRPEERPLKAQPILVQQTETNVECKFCHLNSHPLPNCIRFKRAMRKDRWRFVKINKLCFKCLLAQHDSNSCPAASCDIEDCGLPHHRLLHWPKSNSQPSYSGTAELTPEPATIATVSEDNIDDCEEIVEPIETVTNTNTSQSEVFLKVVPVNIHGPNGVASSHALLDDGATVSLVSRSLADLVGLHGQSETIRVRGAWDGNELFSHSEVVKFVISSPFNNAESFSIRARKLNELCLPEQQLCKINVNNYRHLNPIEKFVTNVNVKPQILLGQDNYHLLVPLKIVQGRLNEPCATLTPLGWCIHGVCSPSSRPGELCATEKHALLAMAPAPAPSGEHPAAHRALCPALPALPAPTPACHTQTGKPSSPPSTSNETTNNAVNDLCDLSTSPRRLEQLMRKYFALDAIGINCKPRQNVNETHAVRRLDETARIKNGQWEVGLPWKGDSEMPDSFPSAYRRLKTIERKSQVNSEFSAKYKERIQHLFQNYYARPLNSDETASRVWYLPHFGVYNSNKGKLRLVFDAAAASGGACLNDYLLQGPDLLESLLGIMLRFREHAIGVSGDIKDMFLRIKIRQEDQHALRFLWRNNSSEPIQKYAMTSLIFGANCSPFVAQYIKNKNAMRFEREKSVAVNAIIKSHYMDDFLDSFETKENAKQVIKDVGWIHEQGGFHMCSWTSNDTEVIGDMPKETLSKSVIKFNFPDDDFERALGLLWYPTSDTLGFNLALHHIPNELLQCERRPTKREILRIVMSIFDVYGFLAPFTIQAKIIIQQTWRQNIDWDQQITDSLFVPFREWIKQLDLVKSIRIPRWYFRPLDSELQITKDDSYVLELHVFCDASPAAYAAVAYWRLCSSNDNVLVSLIASKARVAGIKPTTSVPRLELQAALLGCRLAETIIKEHRLKVDKKYFWTDSTTVLHWIRDNTRSYKTFIANRLGEIDDLSDATDWRYVPTEFNSADIATKQCKLDLSESSMWFRGPPFLHQNNTSWPAEPANMKNIISKDILERINTVHQINNTQCNLPIPEPSRFSSWTRLLRSTAAVLLFIEKCRGNKTAQIDTDRMQKAEVLLLRYSQHSSFNAELTHLKETKQVMKDSRLRALTPLVDGNGLLRVDGRIGAVRQMEDDFIRPFILDGKHHIAQLIIKHHHERAAHASNETVINNLRQRYWIVNLRPTVRSVASKCIFCRIRKANPKPVRMGDLPEARLSHHQRPFTNCGIDLFGPMDVAQGRQRVKRYGVLFTCMTVRAIHVEIVPSLTTDSLLMALRRMAARRGWPRKIISDNGTNLRGANTELRKSLKELDQDFLKDYATNLGVSWYFIPPGSPHMGGAWERLIRSVKTALRVTLKERAPREEVLITLLAEVENMVNSRPLSYVSVDHRDMEALTPNHFLIGSSSNLPPPGAFYDCDLHLRRQWRTAQRLSDMFWQRWTREVLPTLRPRSKWDRDEKQMKVGDVVYVVDPASPRNTWPMGMVEQVHPGADGRVRVVDVRTRRGVMRRPVTRIAVLPVEDECRDSDTGGRIVDDAHTSPYDKTVK